MGFPSPRSSPRSSRGEEEEGAAHSMAVHLDPLPARIGEAEWIARGEGLKVRGLAP